MKLTKVFIIDRYLGIPYKNMGRTLEGLDCYGLILSIYKDAGIELVDIDTYPADWALTDGNHVSSFIEDYSKAWITVSTPVLLDVVGFKNSKGIFNHAGIMLNSSKVINTCRAGTVILDIFGPLKDKVVGYYRHKRFM